MRFQAGAEERGVSLLSSETWVPTGRTHDPPIAGESVTLEESFGDGFLLFKQSDASNQGAVACPA